MRKAARTPPALKRSHKSGSMRSLVGCASILISHEKPGDHRGNHEPGNEIGTGNHEAGDFLAADADGHGAGGEIEPGDGMKDDEEKADDVYGDDDGIFQKALKMRVGFGPEGQRVDLEKHFDDEDGDEDAADFAQD